MENGKNVDYIYEPDYKNLIIEMVHEIDETRDKKILVQVYTILHMYIEKRER